MAINEKPVTLGFLIFLILLSSLLYPQSYVVTNYSDKDGLSMNIGNSVVQDKNGYMWIGCQYGLNRFDGINVRVFTKEDGLPDNYINHLFRDSHGDLWVATSGGLARFDYDNEKFEAFTREKNGLPNNQVRCISESKHLGILVGTDEGLCIITKNGIAIDFPKNPTLLKGKIKCIEVNEQDDEIYLGTLGNGLLIYREGKVISIKKSKDGLPDNNINALVYKGKDLWISTDGGLALYQKDKIIARFTRDNSGLPLKAIRTFLWEEEGNFLIATADGLFSMKDGTISKDPVSTKLAGNNIICLYQDNEGNIWCGAHGGVSCLTRSKFTVFSKEDGLPQNITFGVFENNDHKIWVATYGGIGIIDEEGAIKIESYTTVNSKLPSNTIRTITRDQEGNIWIATFAGGLVKYDGKTFTSYTSENGLPSNNIRIVYVDNQDQLWVGVQDAGLVLFAKQKGKVKSLYNVKNSELLNDNVRFIKKDSHGNLWIGVDGGISKFNLKDHTFTNYSKNEGIECNFTTGILEDKEGYWISTFDGGLYFLDKKLPEGRNIKKFTMKDGLPDNCIYGVVKDNHGWFWLPTNKGVCRWDQKSNKFEYYTVNQGLPSNENNPHACYKDSKGRIWFSTPKGVARFDPKNVYNNTQMPPVYIEEVKVNNGLTDYRGKSLVLRHNENNIFIKFTALCYQFPRGVMFKYKLQGFKDEWKEPLEGNRFVEYTNLSPGDYKFTVIAANSDGIWNTKGASFSFIIKPAFYQTIWFYILCFMGALFMLYCYFRYRSGQQMRLEQKVKERIIELDKIQHRLYQQNKMSSLGVLVAGVAHEMNNPANSIYGNAKFLQKFMEDIKMILAHYKELELPASHEIDNLRTELKIDDKIAEIDTLVKYIREGALRISDIVQALRNFAHVNEADLQPVDIHKGIDDTLFLLNNKIKYKAEVVKKFAEIPLIEGNAGQLNQVFMNLLSNAADAIREQGTISIETRMEKDGRVMIRITDTGEGISKEDQKSIFEPFFTTKSEEGTGLGLSITHSIIEDHNGTINFESIVGQGTTFNVYLPIKQPKKEKGRSTNPPGVRV